MIGEAIGSYRVVSQIGEGGMGAIYLAEQPLLGRKVAVKVLLPEHSRSSEGLERFFQEARATALLRHPALVDVLDCGIHQPTGRAFIIMEYLEGQTLGRRIHEQGRLGVAEAVDVCRQIALGVGIAHAVGIVHRDLKPDNVFLVPDPWRPDRRRAKILDFGIAKLTQEQQGARPHRTRSGVMMGTPLYMAPEQCRGAGTVDARADIYALGCIAYAMLSGEPPFVYPGPGDIIAAHLREPPPSLAARVASLPPGLEAVIMRALAKEPAERFQSMDELGAALLPFDMSGVEAPPASEIVRNALGHTMVLPAANEAPASEAPSPSTAPRTPAVRTGGSRRGTTFSDLASIPTAESAPRRHRAVLVVAISAAVAAAAGLSILLGEMRSGDPRPRAISAAPQSFPAPAVTPSVPAAPPHAPVPAAAPPVPAAAQPVPAAPPPSPPVAEPEPRKAATTVRIAITNAREGLMVKVDGRRSSLPLRLPRDARPHEVVFETPNFRPERRTLVGDRNQTITLANRPSFITQ
jgi:eukaryotic-like serine/threonine-protein kinase